MFSSLALQQPGTRDPDDRLSWAKDGKPDQRSIFKLHQGFRRAAIFGLVGSINYLMSIPGVFHALFSRSHIGSKPTANGTTGNNASLGKLVAKDQIEIAGFFARTRSDMQRRKGLNDAVGFVIHKGVNDKRLTGDRGYFTVWFLGGYLSRYLGDRIG